MFQSKILEGDGKTERLRQFEKTLAVSHRVDTIGGRGGSIGTVTEEVQVEVGVLVLGSTHELHTHDVLVESERLFRIFDANHSMVHASLGGVGLLDALGLLDGVLANDLDPVIYCCKDCSSRGDHACYSLSGSRAKAMLFLRSGVSLGKIHEVSDQILHSAIGELLLKLVAGILDSLASSLDVVYTDANVAEALVRISVTIADLVVVIILSAVVVGKFNDALAVAEVLATRDGIGAIKSQEG